MSSFWTSVRPLTWSPPNILLSKLERDGFDGWTVQWMRNLLEGYIQRVVVNGSVSRGRSMTSAVSRVSILGQWDQVHPQQVCR